ncbi:MAG: AAA family ATPase [Chloroflexota bacterium]
MDFLVRMRLLSGFMLEYQSAAVPITSQRLQALLAYLVLHRGEAQPRQRLAFLLWPDSSESQAHTNLRTLLHRLHAVFPQSEHLIQVDNQAVTWVSDTTLDLDVYDFEQAILQAGVVEQANTDSAVFTALEQAVGAYSGDLLPDCYDEWLLTERERLRHLLFTALEQLIVLLEQRRAYAAAIPHARRLVSLDALNEAACLILMRLHTLKDDRASALRVYHSCVSTLRAELGTEPGTALHAAYERLLAAEALPSIEPVSEGMSASAPLVGRDREWKRMQAIWQVASSGQPRLLILWGEAGIGKTRLAEDLLSWANRQGILTAVARCYAAEGDLAYAPVTALLRSEALRPRLARLNAEWLSEIARLEPDLLTSRPDLRRPGPLNEKWQRQRLFEALARVVLTADQPVILLMDDLQWCDRDTLEWLHFLLRYEVRARLLIVGTVRIEEVTTDNQPLLLLLQALRRENRATEISLNPLSREETSELAGHVAGRALSRERSDTLYRETEGNPLFVVEMLRSKLRLSPAAVESLESAPGSSSAEALGLPPSIRAVVAQRLSQLSPEGRALLEVAAVIGRSFTFGVVAQAVDLDEEAVVRGLDELWQRRVVREQGSDAYDFTHGKLRAVAYAELSAARQRVLHRHVAQALEGEYAATIDAVSGQIALHYQQAGLNRQAVAYHRRAADYARHLYANDVAIIHLQDALALVGDSQPESADLCDRLGAMLHFVGRYEEARAAWGRALAVTPESDRVARADLYRKLGNAWRDQYHFPEAEAAYDAAEAMLGRLNADDSEAAWFCWGQIKLERVNVLYWRGEVRAMLTLIDQLRLQFEQSGSIIQQARLHQMSGVALLRANRYAPIAQAVEHARAYLRMIGEAGDVEALPAAHFQVGFGLLWAADDFAAAEPEIQTALALALQSGDVSLEARCLTYLTVIVRKRGAAEQVRDYAERSLRVAEAAQMYEYVGAAEGNLAWLDWRKGEIAGARAHGQAALAAWSHVPAPYMMEWLGRWPLIAVALADDDLAQARAQARSLLAEHQMRMPDAIESALEVGLRAAEADDPDASRASLRQAAEFAQQMGYL